MNIYNIDTWDRMATRFRYEHLSLPNDVPRDDFTLITLTQFSSRVANGSILNPLIGSIIEPVKTVKFFGVAGTLHSIYTHQSNNVTSIKKALRAVMPSNSTPAHWLILTGTKITFNDDGTIEEYTQHYNTPISTDTELTYQTFRSWCLPENTYTAANQIFEAQYLSIIIRTIL